MEAEIQQLTKRIERMKQKFSSVTNSGMMLSAARALRLEHEREEQQAQQRINQRNQLLHAEEKLQRSLQHLKGGWSAGQWISIAAAVAETPYLLCGSRVWCLWCLWYL